MTNGDKIRRMTNEEMAVVLKGDGLIRYCVAPNEEYCELVMDGLNSGFCDDDCYDFRYALEEYQEAVREKEKQVNRLNESLRELQDKLSSLNREFPSLKQAIEEWQEYQNNMKEQYNDL